MNVVVIGGGGRDGIRSIAKLKKKQEQGTYYDVGIGVSTGAMMICKVLLGEEKDYEDLVTAYTSVTNKDVYSSYPFNSSGDISLYSVIKRGWQGYATVGDMSPILALIRKWLTHDDYIRLRNSGKTAIIAVLNITTGLVEYKSSEDHDYWEFCNYIAASASPEILGNYWTIDDWEYSDAGLSTLVPILKAIEYKPTLLDVFTHRPFKRDIRNGKILDIKAQGKIERIRPMINSVARCVRIFRESLEHLEIREGVKSCLMESIEPTVYYQDTKFKGGNPMIMDSALMKKMYEYELNIFDKTDFRIKFTKGNYKMWFNRQDTLEY